MHQIVIVGAGGFGRELYEWLGHASNQVRGFVADIPPDSEQPIPAPYLGSISNFDLREDDRLVIAIGDPETKKALAGRLEARGARFYTAIHSRAVVATTAKLGDGCIIGPFSYVGPGAVIGQHVALNVHAVCGHDGSVGDFTTLSPHAITGGWSVVGTGAFLGSAAVIAPRVTVGDRSKISAGGLVLRDLPPGSLAVAPVTQSRVMFK